MTDLQSLAKLIESRRPSVASIVRIDFYDHGSCSSESGSNIQFGGTPSGLVGRPMLEPLMGFLNRSGVVVLHQCRAGMAQTFLQELSGYLGGMRVRAGTGVQREFSPGGDGNSLFDWNTGDQVECTPSGCTTF
jgi:hypothetical protein